MAARVESLIRVPTGGAAVSASTGAHTSAATVTVPAGDYYHTAAGGVDSLVDELETQLNASATGLPQSAAAMQAAVGYGTWSAGWNFQIASGNDAGMFGSVTMTAVSSPTYQNVGGAFGTDYAVGFNSAADGFSGGNVFDVDANDDLIIAWLGKHSSLSGNGDMFAKGYADGLPSYLICRETTEVAFYVRDATPDSVRVAVTVPVDTWYVGIAVLDRTTNKSQIGIRTLSGTTTVSGESSTTAVGTMSNASNFLVGNAGVYTPDTGFLLSALYVAEDGACATGLSANLSTALTGFASAAYASFTVSMSTTTGRVTASNSFWPSSISFTSTALRDVLGFEYDFDYPQTAAQMQSVLNAGTYNAGYLCNAASGSLAPVFGTSTSLAPTGTPTYSNQGARGGNDKSVGFDAATENFTGGDDFDVTGTDDLIVFWVGRFTTAPGTEFLFVKGNSGAARWGIYTDSSTLYLECVSASGTKQSSVSIASLTREHHVGMAVVDRANNAMRIGLVGLVSGTSFVASSSTLHASETFANADSFTVGGRNGALGATSWNLSAFYIGVGAGYASGMASNLSTNLAALAAHMLSQTGTEQAEGVWFPDCPLNLEGDPAQAPRVSDLRTTRGPTGIVLGLSGNSFRRHRNIVWSAVPKAQVWESDATYANASWEHFFETTQMGFGHEWFTPASKIQIWFSSAGTDTLIGGDYSDGTGVSGWCITGLDSIEPRKTVDGWTGLWRIEIPELISSG